KVLYDNVVRDRIAIDFFEKEYGKKNFGTFGISRGALNVILTAAVDSRLKYNVLAMGATDFARIMETTHERRIRHYVQDVVDKKNLTEAQVYDAVRALKTEPSKLAQYLNAKDTLMFLALLDNTVPIPQGLELRRQIGGPKTVFVLADHYLTAAYTGMVRVVP